MEAVRGQQQPYFNMEHLGFRASDSTEGQRRMRRKKVVQLVRAGHLLGIII